MKFSFKQFLVPNFKKKLAFMLPAIIFMGIFVSILVELNWGTDPANFLNLNASSFLGWSLGNTTVAIYSLMLIFTFIFGSHLIGFGTIANMILIGYVVDLCRFIYANVGFHEFLINSSFAIRVTFFVVALLCLVVSAAIYMNSQMGVAPYDAMPMIISSWIPKVPFAVIRILFDLLIVFSGFVIGKFSANGMQGSLIGSLAMSFLLGPVITLVGKPLKKFLE